VFEFITQIATNRPKGCSLIVDDNTYFITPCAQNQTTKNKFSLPKSMNMFSKSELRTVSLYCFRRLGPGRLSRRKGGSSNVVRGESERRFGSLKIVNVSISGFSRSRPDL